MIECLEAFTSSWRVVLTVRMSCLSDENLSRYYQYDLHALYECPMDLNKGELTHSREYRAW